VASLCFLFHLECSVKFFSLFSATNGRDLSDRNRVHAAYSFGRFLIVTFLFRVMRENYVGTYCTECSTGAPWFGCSAFLFGVEHHIANKGQKVAMRGPLRRLADVVEGFLCPLQQVSFVKVRPLGWGISAIL
jgi:hypothetical protein